MKANANESRPASENPLAMLGDVARAWNDFWFTPANPTTLCLIRVFVGMIVCYVFLSYSVDLMGYVGPRAWIDAEVFDFLQHRIVNEVMPNDWTSPPHQLRGTYYWSIYFNITDPFWIWTFHGCVLVVAFLFMIGLWTRTTSVLVWLASMNYTQRALTTTFGMDTMMNIMLIYLMIGPSGACLSLDRWLVCRRARLRGEEPPPVMPSVSANFAIRLTQIHFCFIYLSSGLSKLTGSTWWSGTALWFTFLNPTFAPMDNPTYMSLLTWMAQHRWIWEIFMTGGVVFTFVTEIGLPFLIWIPSMRWVMLLCAVMLHTGIGLFMGLVMFSMLMMLLAFSFAPPEQVEAFLASLWQSLLSPNSAAVPKSLQPSVA